MRQLLAWGLLLSTSLLAAPAVPCAVAPPLGEEARVADEEAIIVWDEATKTEQFIRRATFASSAPRLGFLVPTPTEPTLSEVDQGVFGEVRTAIAPRYETKTEGYEVIWSILWGFTRSMSKASVEVSAASPEHVNVLQAVRVAGMDAAVLEANSATALAEWLANNGFASTPTLADWLTPYVAAKWKITAFKYADPEKGGAARNFGADAVKLTFQTDRPFYPYREPIDARAALPEKLRALPRPPRLLRLYFVGDRRMTGTVGDAPWKAETIYGAKAQLPYGPGRIVPEGAVVTAFHDTQDPRPGTDELWFAPAADQSPLEQPPIVVAVPRTIFLPIELMVPAFGSALGVWLVLRNRRQRKLAEESRAP